MSENKDLTFRELRADEIQVRVAMAKPNGVSLLLYKDARCDMKILNETVGKQNWQRKHYECKGNLFVPLALSAVMNGYGKMIVAPRAIMKKRNRRAATPLSVRASHGRLD